MNAAQAAWGLVQRHPVLTLLGGLLVLVAFLAVSAVLLTELVD